MSNKLMIRYESDDFAQWRWISLDNDNKPCGDVHGGDLSALVDHAKGQRLVLVIAGRSLLISSVDLPEGNIRTISSAIPYAMEEQMAEDVGKMHFAQGRRQSDGSIPVIAISKQHLTNLLHALADVGLYPTWAVAEPLLLPWREQELSILIRGDRAIVRDNELSGYECSVNQLPALLKCSNKEHEDLGTIRIWVDDDKVDMGNLLDIGEEQLVVSKAISDFHNLTEYGPKYPRINILQGFNTLESLRPSSESSKPVIALALTAVLLYLGTSIYHYFSLQQEISAVTLKTEELFRETFPDVKRLVQPLVQAQQKLERRLVENGQVTDDLLDLLLVLGEAKQKSKTIEFKNLEYRQNSMVIHLEGKSVAQIEEFKQQLESRGDVNTNILSTVSKDDRVEARIKIKMGST